LGRRNRQLAALAGKLDLSAQELERLNDMKSKFLSMVVHDVRSPLAAIRGYSELLSRKMPGEKEKIQFGNIIGATDQLNRLISDLTDLAMIEAGKLTMTPAPFDLRLIAADILPGIRVRATEKNVVINYFESPSPVQMNGDRFRLGQVLMNLLTNALKFTPAGGRIDLTITAEGARAGVYVKDSGIGVHPSETKKIFEKFYQAKYQKDANLRKQGWGLGLSIATEIIRAHKGEIAATSQGLGKGSTFYYRVPLLQD
jgi:signal transduction histidine kinase